MSATERPERNGLWLIRISKNFEEFLPEILDGLGGKHVKRLGEEYHFIQELDASALSASPASRFVRWKLPLDHSWPCNPEKMENFVEKASQTLEQKFGERGIQGLFVGQLDASSGRGYYKAMASALRGRALQLFFAGKKGGCEVEAQDPVLPSLFCLVGKEGLYCGMLSPREAGGFYPGGTKFISQKAPHTISRAGAKIAEALHHLGLNRKLPDEGSHWLELGACPGGMTSELLERGYRVTAIDRAALDARLDRKEGLTFIKRDVTAFRPPAEDRFDALLCDMNGDPRGALREVIRLSKHLGAGGLVVFTLKTGGVSRYREIQSLYDGALATAARGGLKLIAGTHLTYNRQEFTLFLERG